MTTSTVEIPQELTGLQFRRSKVDDINVRQRIVVLRAVPYDHEIELFPGLFESFEPHMFASQVNDPGRIKLFAERHSTDAGPLVGHATRLEDQAEGPMLHLQVDRIEAGDNLLTLIEGGTLDEASIEFEPIESVPTERGHELHVRRKRGRLRGVAVVPYGAYGQAATVLSLRDDAQARREAAKRRDAELAFLAGLTH